MLKASHLMVGLLFLVHVRNGLCNSCLCGAIPCEEPTCCENTNQLVSDPCGCCQICGNALDEPCGGPFNSAGFCNKELLCERRCECRTVTGKECIFPFTFEGKTYEECTTDASENGEPWCATSVDGAGNTIQNQWADCSFGCPGNGGCTDLDLFNNEGRCISRAIPRAPPIDGSPVKLDEGYSEPVPIEQCVLPEDRLRCKCIVNETNSQDDASNGGACQQTAVNNGYCFLKNVADPSDPTKHCYEDAQWSPTAGRFWSNIGCDELVNAPVEITLDLE